MEIRVVSGIGTGETPLSAFDAALKEAGAYNYNLITLSSIIPPRSTVVELAHLESPTEEYGHRLYVVKSEIRSYEVGKYIAAGLGWYQSRDGDGRGVFVEHEVLGDTEVAVNSEIAWRIKSSIEDLCKFREVEYMEREAKMTVAMTKITKHPTSALVLAVYKSEGWE